MKKVIYVFLGLCLFFSISNVNAGVTGTPSNKITITNVTYNNNKVTIKGTGDGVIQIVLFGEDNNPIYLTTVNSNNGVFNLTLPEIEGLKPGSYNIKVSDYDGENAVTEVVEISTSKTTTTATTTTTTANNSNTDDKTGQQVKTTGVTNPQTYDNIMLYVISGLGAFIGAVILGLNIKKKKN